MKPTYPEALQIAREALEEIATKTFDAVSQVAAQRALIDTATLAPSSEPVAWRRVGWISDAWMFTAHQPTEEIAWEPLYTHPASSEAQAGQTQALDQDHHSRPSAAPASQHDAEAVGELAVRYAQLLAEKRNADAARGFAQGVEYYIADGILRAITELSGRFGAQGRNTQEITSLRSFVLEVSRQDPAQPTGQRESNKERAEDLCEQWGIS